MVSPPSLSCLDFLLGFLVDVSRSSGCVYTLFHTLSGAIWCISLCSSNRFDFRHCAAVVSLFLRVVSSDIVLQWQPSNTALSTNLAALFPFLAQGSGIHIRWLHSNAHPIPF